MTNPDQIQQVINRIWEDDIRGNKRRKEDGYKDSYGNTNFLAKLAKLSSEVFSEFVTLFGKFAAYDQYHFKKVTQSDRHSIINPLSSIHDRFWLHNSDLQKAIFRNNV